MQNWQRQIARVFQGPGRFLDELRSGAGVLDDGLFHNSSSCIIPHVLQKYDKYRLSGFFRDGLERVHMLASGGYSHGFASGFIT